MRVAHRTLAMALVACVGTSASGDELVRFTGQVYDLDVCDGRNRVVVMALSSEGNLVSETASLGALGVLEAALMLGRPIEIAYAPGVPNRIALVRLSASTPVRTGHIQELTYDEKRGCLEARIQLDDGLVTASTKDARLQSLLETALREDRPLEDVQIDPDSKAIDRVVLRILR